MWSTGIFDDKLHSQIVSVGTTANSSLSMFEIIVVYTENIWGYGIYRHFQ